MDDRLDRCVAPMEHIESLAPRLRALTDAGLPRLAATLRARLTNGESVDSVRPEAFAVVGEAATRARRVAVQRQQFIAGAAMHLGYVADVQDGEGRSVAVLLAAFVAALGGTGVHVLSAADHFPRWYAARARDIGDRLGMRIGFVAPGMSPADRSTNYLADITFGTAAEFAFDHLRDNMAWSADQVVQRGRHLAIVDDADVVLIDECRKPRLIMAPADDQIPRVQACARLAPMLVRDRHYTMDDRGTISLTDVGAALAGHQLGIADIYDPAVDVVASIRNALRAKENYRRGRDYDVRDGQLRMLDRQTGQPDRAPLPDGPRQALEAKEGLRISTPNKVLSQITTRHHLLGYSRICGVSAVAAVLPEGFQQLYGLEVVAVPPRQHCRRVEHDDRLFRTDAQRDTAVLAEALRRSETGQPVVIGVVRGEVGARMITVLRDAGVPVRSALGADPEQNAVAVARAGQPGTITVLGSGMGRGVDNAIEGLVVLGAGRHRTWRHDAPLQGMAGRAGTTGECAFFLSAQEVLALDGPDADADAITSRLPDDGLRDPALTARIREFQRHVDLRLVSGHVATNRFMDVLEEQSDAVYTYRRRILDGDPHITDDFRRHVDMFVDQLLDEHGQVLGGTDQQAVTALLTDCPIPFPPGTTRHLAASTDARALLLGAADTAYRTRIDQLDALAGRGGAQQLQGRVLLSCVDKHWRENLAAMHDLYADIRSHPGSLADLVAEFHAESVAAYGRTWSGIWHDAISFFFHLGVQAEGS